ncbi:tRNA guanosine(34) transglycosylase Tgt [Bacteroidota bacterium]
MQFTIQKTDPDSKARAGEIIIERGKIPTPIFMPVGTAGSVKGVLQNHLLDDIQAQIILGNTYHLYLRPGIDVIEKAGGLHRFINWEKPILSDSGGYQVFSLAENSKLSEKGVTFQSHIDGTKYFFSPENVVEIQRSIGADIIMALDECTPYPCDYEYAKKSMELTHRWLKRGIQAFLETIPKYSTEQYFFPIVQGSVYPELRKKSAEIVASFKCKGNAIGGLSVGEPEDEMYEMLSVVNDILPVDKPRYLMGVGTPVNILEAIDLGVDMFDCVMPTRNGRNGMIFTSEGIINIRNKKWQYNFSSLDVNGTSFVDKQYSKAYIRHLFLSNEMLGPIIVSYHNLRFYLWLVEEARKKILDGSFKKWKGDMAEKLNKKI